jgi:hypothetical protein
MSFCAGKRTQLERNKIKHKHKGLAEEERYTGESRLARVGKRKTKSFTQTKMT